MKSLQRRFQNIQQKNPSYSSYLCFAEAVRGQRFGSERLHRWFNKLVEKDDYAPSEKKQILRHLEHLTDMPEAYVK